MAASLRVSLRLGGGCNKRADILDLSGIKRDQENGIETNTR